MSHRSEETYHDLNYFCDRCQTRRHLKINKEKHMNLGEDSKNGLVIYSDIHRCNDGLNEVTNLQVDKNFDIRSYEFLKLPEYRKKSKAMIPIPGMEKSDKDINLLQIMEIDLNTNVNLVLNDHFLQSKIRIGRFDPMTEPIDTLESELGGITFFVYESDIPYGNTLKKWYQYLIDTLEILPPTKLGMLIETLRYFLDQYDTNPSDFDKSFVKTILASHEIFFEIKDITKITDLHQKYSDTLTTEDFDVIDNYLSMLQDNPGMPIQFFTDKSEKDLIYQIYIFLILEKEGIVQIERPGIVEMT